MALAVANRVANQPSVLLFAQNVKSLDRRSFDWRDVRKIASQLYARRLSTYSNIYFYAFIVRKKSIENE